MTRFDQWVTIGWPEDYRMGLRVGQSYMNRLWPSYACPTIFYEENPSKAWDLIQKAEETGELPK